MKPLLIFLFVFTAAFPAIAQSPQDCNMGDVPVYIIDSFDFEMSATGVGRLVVDTTFPGNIWQIGAVQKPGFSNAFSGVNALQTDTLQPYPVNNESAVILYSDSVRSLPALNFASLIFWHYYETDTLQDSCILQITIDSGKTWINMPGLGMIGDLLVQHMSTGFSSGSNFLWWSGSSKGWRRESICMSFLLVKGMSLPKPTAFRFLFHSDSIQTNKPGWMIDNLELKTTQLFAGISDHQTTGPAIFPNPSADGVYSISYPSHYVNGTIELYNVRGQKVRTLPLATHLDIHELPAGIYHYRILFNQTGQQFSGSIIYR